MSTNSDYNYVPSSPQDDDSYTDSSPSLQQHSLVNNKVMMSVIVVLFSLIFFITILHIFAKWLWRSRSRNTNTIRFYGQEQSTSAARSAGLSKAVIAQLSTFTYTGTAEDNAGFLECAVCLSEFQENEKGRLLPSCKHSFHIECIDMWFYSHSTCPLCRMVVMPTITSSPSMPPTVTTHEQQQERDEEALQEAHISIETTVPPASTHVDIRPFAIPEGSDHLAHAAQIPTNVLFCSNSDTQLLPSQLGSFQSSDKSSSSTSAKATRPIPHITIEIPTRQLDINVSSPGCLSLPSRRSRCTSPYDCTGSSSRTSVKSPSLLVSFKRLTLQ